MGKQMFQEMYVSPTRTQALGIPELTVVGEMDAPETRESTYHAVHVSYFQKKRLSCPLCKGIRTAETKIVGRKFKDLLPATEGKQKVIDLIFHQRYFRCSDCKNHVFHENIEFAEEGCRYTNRLSDLLAEGTLTRTYERVCKDYGVPASKASVGVIMRRRIRLRLEQQPPLLTPETLVIFVSYYHSEAYPVVLGIFNDNVRFLDILSSSSSDAYAVFFGKLDKERIKRIYIDPDEQMHMAVNEAFPHAAILMSEECVRRYLSDALKEVIRNDATRFTLRRRYHLLTVQEKYLSEYEQNQIRERLKKRHRLRAAYNAYQDLLSRMESGWSIPLIQNWITDELPDYLRDEWTEDTPPEAFNEFDLVKNVLDIYQTEIHDGLSSAGHLPAVIDAAVRGILDAIDAMPYCVYDVLHARMLLNTEHERVNEDGIIYRRGIKVERLTEKMTEIGENIRKKKEDESYGFKPSH